MKSKYNILFVLFCTIFGSQNAQCAAEADPAGSEDEGSSASSSSSTTKSIFYVKDIYNRFWAVESKPDCTVTEFISNVRNALIKSESTKDWSDIEIVVSEGANCMSEIDKEGKEKTLSDYNIGPGCLNLIIGLYLPTKAYVYSIKECVPDLKKTDS